MTKTTKAQPTIGSTKRRPNLFFSESQLSRAYAALEEIDPDLELPASEHESILAQYVDRKAALELRDEFREFCEDVEGVIAAKYAQARLYADQAERMENSLEHMKQGVARMMDAQKVDELRGTTGAIILKRSRGSVDVVASALVPKEFMRLPDSVHLRDVSTLVEIVEKLAARCVRSEYCINGMDRESRDEIDGLVNEETRVVEARKIKTDLEAELRVVDKVKVQEAWKANGGNDYVVEADESMREELIAAREAGAITQEELAEKSLVATRRVPLVPGCAKVVKLSLAFK